MFNILSKNSYTHTKKHWICASGALKKNIGHKRVPYSQNVPVALKHLTLSNNPFTSFNGLTHWLRPLSSKLLNKTLRQSSVSSHQRRVSIGRISLTPIMTMEESDKNKLGCQTGGLGNNKPPTNSTASHESSNFISVTGDFQSTRKCSAV